MYSRAAQFCIADTLDLQSVVAVAARLPAEGASTLCDLVFVITAIDMIIAKMFPVGVAETNIY